MSERKTDEAVTVLGVEFCEKDYGHTRARRTFAMRGCDTKWDLGTLYQWKAGDWAYCPSNPGGYVPVPVMAAVAKFVEEDDKKPTPKTAAETLDARNRRC